MSGPYKDFPLAVRDTLRAPSLKEAIRIWREFAKTRAEYWRLAEEVARRTGLDADAQHCTLRRIEFLELLECLDELERAAV